MTNLFAWRAKEPQWMMRAERPIGEENDSWLARCAREADVVVAAWGARGDFMARDREVIDLLGPMLCLGVTKAGHPRHPLFVRGATKLVDFEPVGATTGKHRR